MKTNIQSFVAACVDQNTVEELDIAYMIGPDAIDMRTWGLSEDQWEAAVCIAIEELSAA